MLSLSLVLFIFTISFLFGSIYLKPYISLNAQNRDYIVILCLYNLFFTSIFILNAIRLERVFRLENKHIINYGKKLGVFTIFYIPHFFFVMFLLFIDLHNIEKLIVFLIIFIEALLIGLILKESYDLVFLMESKRDFELKKNRQRYFEK